MVAFICFFMRNYAVYAQIKPPMYTLNNSSPYRIFLAVSIAILFHTLLGILLFQLLPKIEQKKTIPIQLVITSKTTSQSIKTQNSTPSNKPEEDAQDILNKEHQKNAANKIITTSGTSNTSISSSQDKSKERDSKTTPTQTLKPIKQENIFIPKIKTDLPDVRLDIAKSSKSHAASKSFTDLSSLFSQQKDMEASVTQISSNPKLPQLSDYEQKLFAKLNTAKFHDQLHPIISQLQSSKTLTLKLVLFSNGSLKNAFITETSNDKPLDKAVRRIALDASPYPTPPPEDKSIGYKYQVTIQYNPISVQ